MSNDFESINNSHILSPYQEYIFNLPPVPKFILRYHADYADTAHGVSKR